MQPAVGLDLDEGMDKVRETLSKYPVKTRFNVKGTLIVARDIAHARIKQMIDEGKPMPEYFKKHPIYYAGPAKTPQGYGFGELWSRPLQVVWIRTWICSRVWAVRW